MPEISLIHSSGVVEEDGMYVSYLLYKVTQEDTVKMLALELYLLHRICAIKGINEVRIVEFSEMFNAGRTDFDYVK